MNIGSDEAPGGGVLRAGPLNSCDQTGQILLERPEFQVRFATEALADQSHCLVSRRYAWRGYKVPTHQGRSVSDEITLQACERERVFGTLTLRLDSGCGLAADALYSAELNACRDAGMRIGELTRLAVDPEIGSKQVLGALFHMAYVFFGPLNGVQTVFIEVHPRHVPFYRRMLGFQRAGACRHSDRVDAPAVLLKADVARVGAHAARHGGGQSEALRTLYPYFCSQEEEARAVALALLNGGSVAAATPVAPLALCSGGPAEPIAASAV